LVEYERLNSTKYSHHRGDVVTFKGRLTAIAGQNYRMVEVSVGKYNLYHKPIINIISNN